MEVFRGEFVCREQERCKYSGTCAAAGASWGFVPDVRYSYSYKEEGEGVVTTIATCLDFTDSKKERYINAN